MKCPLTDFILPVVTMPQSLVGKSSSCGFASITVTPRLPFNLAPRVRAASAPPLGRPASAYIKQRPADSKARPRKEVCCSPACLINAAIFGVASAASSDQPANSRIFRVAGAGQLLSSATDSKTAVSWVQAISKALFSSLA